MTVDTMLKELGNIVVGQPHQFRYTLTTDNGPVVIKRFAVGCGSCTTVSIEKNHLDPEQITYLNVTFTPSMKGDQIKSVSIIYTENDIEINMELRFHATVI